MDKLLGVGENDVRMVGIWGIGGIGKSTIAKAVYNSIAHKFQGCCFLANVRDISTRKGLVKQQKSVLLNILGGKKLEVTNADKGVTLIQERLGCKKVLVILDDVNKLDQLNKLAGGFDWFGSGSRVVIITSRDRDLLTAHQVNLIYNVSEFGCDEAFQLLSFHALKGNRHMDEDCVKLANTIVDYAKGLPLVLTVFGLLLCGSTLRELNISGSDFGSLPKCMSSFVKLERLTIFGCKRLQEIPELPQTIKKVSVRDYVSLKRFAKLSNIMNRKESQMILFLNMANCRRLFDNLVRSAKKKFMLLNEVELSSIFLSSQRSAFQVAFPGSDVPNWFSCRKVLKDLRECEFSVTIPHTFQMGGQKDWLFCGAKNN